MNVLPLLVAISLLCSNHSNTSKLIKGAKNDGMCCSYRNETVGNDANALVLDKAVMGLNNKNKLQLLSVFFAVQYNPSSAFLSSSKSSSSISPIIGSLASPRRSQSLQETCSPGWYMDDTIEQGINQTTRSMCQQCPIGTFNRAYGATSIDWCFECPAGTYNNQTGK